jgi:thiol-disulfide isomerase/thioredoxin
MLDDEYNNFMNSIDLNDAYMLDYEGYKSLLKTYVYSHAEQIDSIFHFIQLNFNNQKVTNYLSYTLFKEHLNDEEVLYIDSLMTSYGMLQSNEDYYLELFDLANELKKFQKGQTAINFSYPDINGDTIALSDFIGSYVYVDVWATWCGPCKREIPDLIKLEHDYADKNIVFMSISVDEEEDRNTWLTMVNERGLGGVQLFASGWSHITKSYKINGIPRFMLFDPEGNIINVRTTRPSDPNTRIVFDEILL